MGYLSRHYHGHADIKLCQVDAPELDDRALVTVLASGFSDPIESLPEAEPEEVESHAEPARTAGDSRIYGDAAQAQPGGDQPLTPTRLLPQAPTPSGELATLAEDLHVPAIIRMTQGRLPIE
jgi:cell division protein FtsZ